MKSEWSIWSDSRTISEQARHDGLMEFKNRGTDCIRHNWQKTYKGPRRNRYSRIEQLADVVTLTMKFRI